MIKNLIFDLGGILLDLDFAATDERFKQLFKISFDNRAYPEAFYEVFDGYEQGFFSEASYLYRLQKLAGHPILERDLVDAWNAMLVRLPLHRLEMLEKLRSDYKVYLLSNTNFTHICWLRNYLHREYGIVDFETRYFDHAFYSYEMDKRKPNADIYQAVLEEAGLEGAESIFIDDTMPNIITARECGIHAAWHDPKLEITEMIRGYIKHAEG